MPRQPHSHHEIVSLAETAPGKWKAQYEGNYGTYFIKLTLQGNKLKEHSCSCPSDYSPCKHVGYVMEAIGAEGDKIKGAQKERSTALALLMQRVGEKELKEFVAKEALFDEALYKKLLRQWPPVRAKGSDPNAILRKKLKAEHINAEDYYYSEESAEVETLDDWLEEAQSLTATSPHDALGMLMAYVMEVEDWLQQQPDEATDMLDPRYFETPFELLSKLSVQDGLRPKVFAAVLREAGRSRYEDSLQRAGLLALLTQTAQSSEEVEAASSLLHGLLKGRTSNDWEQESLVMHLLAVAKNAGDKAQPEALLQQYLHLPGIRLEYGRLLAQRRRWAELRELGESYLEKKPDGYVQYAPEWWGLLLRAAEASKDQAAIRRWTFAPLERGFETAAWRKHKAAFTGAEWPAQRALLFRHYDKARGYNESHAAALTEEGMIEELLAYVRKHLSLPLIEKWSAILAKDNPAATAQLFEAAIEDHLEKNMGRSVYEYSTGMLKKMAVVPGGGVVAKALAQRLKMKYANRRAMLEVMKGAGF